MKAERYLRMAEYQYYTVDQILYAAAQDIGSTLKYRFGTKWVQFNDGSKLKLDEEGTLRALYD